MRPKSVVATSAVARLRAACTLPRRPLLICYLPVGDPDAAAATARVYTECGVDIVEAGLPVRHPLLDGAEITGSMHRAIAAGVFGPSAADDLSAQLESAGQPPALWMSYNAKPTTTYLDMVASSGVGGVLLPDADQAELAGLATDRGLTTIPFIDHVPQLAQIIAARHADAYVMVAAAAGVTGPRAGVDPDNAPLLEHLRSAGVSTPLALGFGISSADQARQAIAMGADGVIVGSACVKAARAGSTALTGFLRELRVAIDA